MSDTTATTTTTRPYLIRALYEWCADNGLTPYIAVMVDDSVKVPLEYVKNGEIVLNISLDATSALQLGNEVIEFKARFAGTARDIMVPVERVIAIYARENGQGMAFPLPSQTPVGPSADSLRMLAAPATHARAAGAADNVVPLSSAEADAQGPAGLPPVEPQPPKPGKGGGRPALKRIK